jgi:hypothetical protein
MCLHVIDFDERAYPSPIANPLANETPTNSEPIKPGPRVNAIASNS